MSLRVQIIDPRRTFIAGLFRRNGEINSRYLGLAVHRHAKDWGAIFSRALDLLMEEPTARDQVVTFASGAGRIVWQPHAFWTIIRLDLGTYSRKKRRLIAAALLKTARNGI
jgi:hypothetical protein